MTVEHRTDKPDRELEQVLIRRMVSGEEVAFELFSDLYIPVMYRFVQRSLKCVSRVAIDKQVECPERLFQVSNPLLQRSDPVLERSDPVLERRSGPIPSNLDFLRVASIGRLETNRRIERYLNTKIGLLQA